MRKRIYIAGPYSSNEPGGIQRNILRAEAKGIELLKLGFAPLIPHKNTAHWETLPDLDYTMFMALDLAWLAVADVVYFLSNWRDSPGAQIEMAEAQNRLVPIVVEGDGAEMDILNRILGE